jgi:hypothetical protein
MGARITEMPVQHHPRRFGKSKYGLMRTIKVLLDLIVIGFLHRYFVKPIYVFGGFATIALLLSGLCTTYMLYLKFAQGVSFISTPLPVLIAMTFMVGIMSVLMGLLAEMIVRTYFESQHRGAYVVRNILNHEKN